MDNIIAAPASCEVRAVIRFLHAEGQSAAEIRRLCRVYGDTVMSDNCVRKWRRKFRDGRTDVHDEGGQGRHSSLKNSFKKSTSVCVENIASRYQNFLKNFHKFRGLICIKLSRTDWVTISSVHGGYQNN